MVRLGPGSHSGPHGALILTLEPVHVGLRSLHPRNNDSFPGGFACDYVVAGFSFPASNASPFFHTRSVIATILRASATRAISSPIPLAISPA